MKLQSDIHSFRIMQRDNKFFLLRLEGFSLIEVVLAVGVAAFALVALMGLLPVGLATFKSTMNTAVGTQISQRVFNDLQVSDFSALQSTNRYFDEQGNDLGPNSNALNCIYWVQVTLVSNPVITGNISTNLKTVQLMIANNPGGALSTNVLFSGTNKNTAMFSTVIGR